MKGTLKTDTKVGLFVILGAVVLAVGTTLVGKFHWGRKPGYAVTAVFGSVSGLDEKSSVRIAGVRVGEIESIYLKDGLAYVRMRLNPDAVIREDSEVSVSSLGLLGEKYLEISSGTPSKPVVKAGEVVHGRDAVNMDKLISEFTDVATDIKAVTASLRAFLGPEEDKSPVRAMMNKFDLLAENLNSLIGENKQGIGRAVTDLSDFARRADKLIADNQEDLRATVKNFRGLSDNLQRDLKSLVDKLSGLSDNVGGQVSGVRKDFSSGMDEVKKLTARIDDTFKSMQDIIEKAKRGEGTLGKLISDDSAYTNFNKTMGSIAKVSEKIEKGEGTIGKLMTDEKAYDSLQKGLDSINRFMTRGEQIHLFVGFRSEFLFDNSDTKSYFSLRINPREDKFYLLEAVNDPGGMRSFTETVTTTRLDDGPTTTEFKHEDILDDKLKFSFLFGRRWGDFTLRGGLMESTGGAGGDWFFDKDRGRISLDVFDFNRPDAKPHLKMTAAMSIYKDLYLNAGLDDILESGTRSFFIGAGLYFSDDDLKYILSLANLRP